MRGVLMKFIEGFLILKFKRGSKKGQEYIKNTKRYIWIVPDYLLNDIELGDEVLVNSTRYDNKNKKYKPAKEKVLVVNIFEKDEEPIKRKMVLKILKKNKTKNDLYIKNFRRKILLKKGGIFASFFYKIFC